MDKISEYGVGDIFAFGIDRALVASKMAAAGLLVGLPAGLLIERSGTALYSWMVALIALLIGIVAATLVWMREQTKDKRKRQTNKIYVVQRAVVRPAKQWNPAMLEGWRIKVLPKDSDVNGSWRFGTVTKTRRANDKVLFLVQFDHEGEPVWINAKKKKWIHAQPLDDDQRRELYKLNVEHSALKTMY
eukprot:g2581.t1